MARTIMGLLTAAALAVFVWSIHANGLAAGRSEVRALWAQQRAADAALLAQLTSRAREREQALQFTADKLRQEKTLEIRHLSAARDAALRELRHRNERPTDGGHAAATPNPAGAGPAASCTGLELYRPDAEFLVREAARADEVRASLIECRAAYDAARSALQQP